MSILYNIFQKNTKGLMSFLLPKVNNQQELVDIFFFNTSIKD